jgi:ACS family tartrate transporter-like MFS transporter
LINSLGNVGGFVGPYAIGAIIKKTGSSRAGLIFVAITLLISAMLILAFREEDPRP